MLVYFMRPYFFECVPPPYHGSRLKNREAEAAARKEKTDAGPPRADELFMFGRFICKTI